MLNWLRADDWMKLVPEDQVILVIETVVCGTVSEDMRTAPHANMAHINARITRTSSLTQGSSCEISVARKVEKLSYCNFHLLFFAANSWDVATSAATAVTCC